MSLRGRATGKRAQPGVLQYAEIVPSIVIRGIMTTSTAVSVTVWYDYT